MEKLLSALIKVFVYFSTIKNIQPAIINFDWKQSYRYISLNRSDFLHRCFSTSLPSFYIYLNNKSLTIFEKEKLSLVKFKENNLNIIKVTAPSYDFTTTDFSIVENKYGWNTFSSNIFYQIFSLKDLKIELTFFIKFFKNNYKNTKYFAILFKIRFSNNDIRTCSTTQVAHIDSINALYSIFSKIFFVENFAEAVSEPDDIFTKEKYFGGSVFFTYKPLRDVKTTKFEDFTILGDQKYQLKKLKDYNYDFKYKNFIIPSTMDLFEWPNIKFNENYDNAFASYTLENNNESYNLSFNITIKDKTTFINVWNRDIVLFTIEDSLNNISDLSDFKRVIIENNNKKTYYFFNGEVKLYCNEINTSFIKKIPKDLNKKTKILSIY